MISDLIDRHIAWRNRFRTEHPNLWHPIRFTFMLVALLWILLGIAMVPPHNAAAIVWNLIELVVLALSPVYPKSSSTAFIAMELIGTFAIAESSTSLMPGVMYAFGLLAYETSNIVGLLLVCYMTAYLIIQTYVCGMSAGNNVAIIAMFGLCVLLGRGLRWRENLSRERLEAIKTKSRLAEIENKGQISDAIHDAVTGDLSAAAFITQRHLANEGSFASSASDQEDWRQVNEYILSALTSVHSVIDELNAKPQTVVKSDADGDALVKLLSASMEKGDARMRRLGFNMTSVCHTAGGVPSASREVSELVDGLLREVYANIARHAEPGCTVDLSVMFKPNAIEITQINAVKSGDGVDELPGGHGLDAFRKQLESHHGTIATTSRNGEWTLFAYLPVTVVDTSPGLIGI